MEESPKAGPYDCQQCGACCVDASGNVGYVYLTVLEAVRMEKLGLPVVNEEEGAYLGSWCHDGPGGGRLCSALAGTVGEATALASA